MDLNYEDDKVNNEKNNRKWKAKIDILALFESVKVAVSQFGDVGYWKPTLPLNYKISSAEIISNGIYRSIEHRATVNSEKERLSIATFYSARHDCEIGPASNLVSEERAAQFKRITMEEYVRGLLARELDGKSYLDSLRIEHST